jgi:hypothetical protein
MFYYCYFGFYCFIDVAYYLIFYIDFTVSYIRVYFAITYSFYSIIGYGLIYYITGSFTIGAS